MPRAPFIFIALVVLVAAQAAAQTVKIPLDAGSVTRLTGSGSPGTLLDEQVFVGNVEANDGGPAPSTSWGYAGSARVALPASYAVSTIWLYDSNGIAGDGGFTIDATIDGGSTRVVTSHLADWQKWKRFSFAPVTTHELTVTATTGAGMPEMVVYGAAVAPPSGVVAKITVDAGWVTRITPASSGEPGRLFDEQDLVGDPNDGGRAAPSSVWGVTGSALLTLPVDYVISKVWLYDTFGNAPDGGFKVIAETSSGPQTVVQSSLDLWQVWRAYSFAPVVTRRLTVSNSNGGAGMPELVLYGYPASVAPVDAGTPIDAGSPVNQPPVMQALADLTLSVGAGGSVPLSATDAEGDAISFQQVTSFPYVSVATTGVGAGTLTVSTSAPVGTDVTVTVRAFTVPGSATRSFRLRVIASTLGGTQTAIAAVTTYPNPHLGYLEYVPAGYNAADLSVKYPVVFFFHGQGDKGTGAVADLEKLLTGDIAPPLMLAASASSGNQLQPLLPEQAIFLSPQMNNIVWSGTDAANFVQYALGFYAGKIDTKRIYLTGLSLGGGGVWDAVNTQLSPGSTNVVTTRSQVAALVAVCGNSGGTDYSSYTMFPVWAFHNTGDSAAIGGVPYTKTTDKLTQMTGVNPNLTRPAGPGATNTAYFNTTTGAWVWAAGTAAPLSGVPAQPYQRLIFTAKKATAHDAWAAAYKNADLWKWLFSQSKP